MIRSSSIQIAAIILVGKEARLPVMRLLDEMNGNIWQYDRGTPRYDGLH
jgi:hypothetical protein